MSVHIPADYLASNKDSWNKRTLQHITSDFYDVPGFLAGASSLNPIELGLLGEVRGKSILHLQCHFGQDSLSLARMGAKVTGVDLSDVAIDKAREYNAQLDLDARFVCSDVYALGLDEQFDMVFTSYGTIGWLPDLDRWAEVIARHLKPGGKLVFVEFHPVVWMFDDTFETVAYNYFRDDAIVEENNGTYTDRDAAITHTHVSWNHGLAEVLTALLGKGLKLEVFEEFDYSPYNCFRGMVKTGERQYRIAHMSNRLPLVYALRAVRD